MAAPVSPSNTGNGRIGVSQLVTDAVQSLRPWPVWLTVNGEELEIPALCAADWLAILMNEDLDLEDVLPGLLGDEDDEILEELLLEGLLTVDDKDQLSLEVISTVAGRPWWVALRLIGAASHSWDALGAEMVRKADASRLSLSAWLDVLFHTTLLATDEDKRTMFQLKLEVPPEGYGPKPEELTIGTDTFMSMAGDG